MRGWAQCNFVTIVVSRSLTSFPPQTLLISCYTNPPLLLLFSIFFTEGFFTSLFTLALGWGTGGLAAAWGYLIWSQKKKANLFMCRAHHKSLASILHDLTIFTRRFKFWFQVSFTGDYPCFCELIPRSILPPEGSGGGKFLRDLALPGALLCRRLCTTIFPGRRRRYGGYVLFITTQILSIFAVLFFVLTRARFKHN